MTPARAESHRDPEEQALVRRVVEKDDHSAFEQLVRLHQSRVRQFLRRLTAGDLERADDLAQETFFKAYRHLAGYRGDGKLRSWLFSIAYQLFVSDQRRRSKARLSPLEIEPAAPRIDGRQVELSHTVESMLTCLRSEERAAVLMCYQHDLTHEEAAAALDLPLGTLKSLVRRARLKMKQIYAATKESA